MEEAGTFAVSLVRRAVSGGVKLCECCAFTVHNISVVDLKDSAVLVL